MAGSIQAASILAAETAPEEEHNILLPAFYDIFWGGICFLILLFVVWRYALPRIRQTLEERTAGIEGKLATAERDRAQAESLLAQYRPGWPRPVRMRLSSRGSAVRPQGHR